jgi:hypothetical protein
MKEWIIFRRGSNAANQTMTPVMCLGIIEAETQKQAWEKAQEKWEFYNNQFCEAYKWNGSWRGLPKGYWELVD